MPAYTDLFFDLDRTLIDFDKSSHETLQQLFEELVPPEEKKRIGFQDFLTSYTSINLILWEQYREKQITKAFLNLNRFKQTFESLDLDCPEVSKFAEEYVARSSVSVHLYPETMDVLNYLRPRYRLHIITNGFQEVQEGKLRVSGLKAYFDCIITSDEAGFMKPDARIFEYALRCAQTLPERSLMIGDDFPVDIEGAKAAGIDQALILWKPIDNNHFKCNYTLSSLSGLRDIL